ncbi:PepSY domain-containing protein [Rheinheimera sp.]|uniref:PepSY domain-containing protein n=1 Tax=Rheinheimera sp. TaxID=1869214 RepID=UPI003AF9F649
MKLGLRAPLWRTLHKYLGWLLLFQLLAWFGSGLIMTLLPIDQVHGDHLRQALPAASWQQAVAPAAVLAGKADASLSLSQRGTEPVYLLNRQGEQSTYSALTAEPLALLTEAEALQLAQAQYKGPAPAATLALLQQAPFEVRHLRGPLWQVSWQDQEHSAFYLHAFTGTALSVRTDNWRLFDFVWMLHIMDYQERENFNSPLLMLFSATALLFTFTGLVLLWPRSRNQRARLSTAMARNSSRPL